MKNIIANLHQFKKYSKLLFLIKLLTSFLFIMSLSSCKESGIRKYTVEKEKSPSLNLIWTKPDAWQSKKLTEFRKGSFEAITPFGKCDISIISFPFQAGGYLANINRWRSQLSLKPIEEKDLQSLIEKKQFKHLKLECISLENTETIMKVAMVMIKNETWFLKCVGPKKAIHYEEKNWDTFLNTLYEKNPS